MEFDEKKEPSWFPNAKIYHDGSQFVAIPHTTVRRKKRGKHKEEVFVVADNAPIEKKAIAVPTLEELDTDEYEEMECPFEEEVEAYYTEQQVKYKNQYKRWRYPRQGKQNQSLNV